MKKKSKIEYDIFFDSDDESLHSHNSKHSDNSIKPSRKKAVLSTLSKTLSLSTLFKQNSFKSSSTSLSTLSLKDLNSDTTISNLNISILRRLPNEYIDKSKRKLVLKKHSIKRKRQNRSKSVKFHLFTQYFVYESVYNGLSLRLSQVNKTNNMKKIPLRRKKEVKEKDICVIGLLEIKFRYLYTENLLNSLTNQNYKNIFNFWKTYSISHQRTTTITTNDIILKYYLKKIFKLRDYDSKQSCLILSSLRSLPKLFILDSQLLHDTLKDKLSHLLATFDLITDTSSKEDIDSLYDEVYGCFQWFRKYVRLHRVKLYLIFRYFKIILKISLVFKNDKEDEREREGEYGFEEIYDQSINILLVNSLLNERIKIIHQLNDILSYADHKLTKNESLAVRADNYFSNQRIVNRRRYNRKYGKKLSKKEDKMYKNTQRRGYLLKVLIELNRVTSIQLLLNEDINLTKLTITDKSRIKGYSYSRGKTFYEKFEPRAMAFYKLINISDSKSLKQKLLSQQVLTQLSQFSSPEMYTTSSKRKELKSHGRVLKLSLNLFSDLAKTWLKIENKRLKLEASLVSQQYIVSKLRKRQRRENFGLVERAQDTGERLNHSLNILNKLKTTYDDFKQKYLLFKVNSNGSGVDLSNTKWLTEINFEANEDNFVQNSALSYYFSIIYEIRRHLRTPTTKIFSKSVENRKVKRFVHSIILQEALLTSNWNIALFLLPKYTSSKVKVGLEDRELIISKLYTKEVKKLINLTFITLVHSLKKVNNTLNQIFKSILFLLEYCSQVITVKNKKKMIRIIIKYSCFNNSHTLKSSLCLNTTLLIKKQEEEKKKEFEDPCYYLDRVLCYEGVLLLIIDDYISLVNILDISLTLNLSNSLKLYLEYFKNHKGIPNKNKIIIFKEILINIIKKNNNLNLISNIFKTLFILEKKDIQRDKERMKEEDEEGLIKNMINIEKVIINCFIELNVNNSSHVLLYLLNNIKILDELNTSILSITCLVRVVKELIKDNNLINYENNRKYELLQPLHKVKLFRIIITLLRDRKKEVEKREIVAELNTLLREVEESIEDNKNIYWLEGVKKLYFLFEEELTARNKDIGSYYCLK